MSNSKSIFVGNIPYEYDEKSLKETLSLVGPAKALNIKYIILIYNLDMMMTLRNQKDLDFLNILIQK